MSDRYGIAERRRRPFLSLSPAERRQLAGTAMQGREVGGRYRLMRGGMEVLTLEASCEKLLAAEAIQREAFEQELRDRLEAVD